VAEDTTAAASVPEAGQGAADGGRWVEVAPERLARWVATFAERHGAISVEPGRLAVTFRAVRRSLPCLRRPGAPGQGIR